jgi:hypothetical protein
MIAFVSDKKKIVENEWNEPSSVAAVCVAWASFDVAVATSPPSPLIYFFLGVAPKKDPIFDQDNNYIRRIIIR